jgi:transcriptional regulator with XRE-family HTH domain
VAFGRRIREWRIERRWSQAELADRAGLSQRQVSRIERDEVTPLRRETLIRLGEALESPLVSGEVNMWLMHSGYAPLVRPALPLPDRLGRPVPDAPPRLIFDPSGALRQGSPAGLSVVGQFDSDLARFNLLAFTLGNTNGVFGSDRDRLWYWLVLGVALAPPEPWAAKLRDTIEGAWHRSLHDVWTLLRQALSAPGVWEAPLTVETPDQSLHFFPAAETYPMRPDLQVLNLVPADPATIEWCRNASAARVSNRRA